MLILLGLLFSVPFAAYGVWPNTAGDAGWCKVVKSKYSSNEGIPLYFLTITRNVMENGKKVKKTKFVKGGDIVQTGALFDELVAAGACGPDAKEIADCKKIRRTAEAGDEVSKKVVCSVELRGDSKSFPESLTFDLVHTYTNEPPIQGIDFDIRRPDTGSCACLEFNFDKLPNYSDTPFDPGIDAEMSLEAKNYRDLKLLGLRNMSTSTYQMYLDEQQNIRDGKISRPTFKGRSQQLERVKIYKREATPKGDKPAPGSIERKNPTRGGVVQ